MNISLSSTDIDQLRRSLLTEIAGIPHPLVGGDERQVNQAVRCRADLQRSTELTINLFRAQLKL